MLQYTVYIYICGRCEIVQLRLKVTDDGLYTYLPDEV